MTFVRRKIKREAIKAFEKFVFPAKVRFFSMVGIDFVPAKGESVWYPDLDGNSSLVAIPLTMRTVVKRFFLPEKIEK